MSHSNSPSPQGTKRCIYSSTDGVSVINLPLTGDETFSLIDSAGGNIRLLRFDSADAERISAALEAGASFRFANEKLQLRGSSGCREFSPLAPDAAPGSPPALPGPSEIQRLHAASDPTPAP